MLLWPSKPRNLLLRPSRNWIILSWRWLNPFDHHPLHMIAAVDFCCMIMPHAWHDAFLSLLLTTLFPIFSRGFLKSQPKLHIVLIFFWTSSFSGKKGKVFNIPSKTSVVHWECSQELGGGGHEAGCDWYWTWSHFCGTIEGMLSHKQILFLYVYSLLCFKTYHGPQFLEMSLCNALICFSCCSDFPNCYRIHRTPAEIADLLSLSIITMHVQNTQDKRCQTQNLSLMTMLQLWAGRTLGIWSPLHRLRLLTLCSHPFGYTFQFLNDLYNVVESWHITFVCPG